MARPRKEINRTTFENACSLQCTLEEMACLFGCSVDTVERWCEREYGKCFAEVYKMHAEDGKMSLRRNQFKLSKVNATMAIWLGKQWLGQRDHLENNKPQDDKIEINVNFRDFSKEQST